MKDATELEAKRTLWNTSNLSQNFTRIEDWDNDNPPESFRFMVRTVMTTIGTWENHHKPSLVKEMELIQDSSVSRLVSASLIDEDHKFAFGDVGFILETDGENVVTANSKDIHWWQLKNKWGFTKEGDEAEFARDLTEKFGIKTPDEVLRDTPKVGNLPFNEIVFFQDPGHKSDLKPKGVIYFVNDVLSQDKYEKLKGFAESLNLPLIIIKRW